MIARYVPCLAVILGLLAVMEQHGVAQDTNAQHSALAANPGCDIQRMAVVNGRVVFDAHTAPYGKELWAFDPGTGVTTMMQDICPGPCGSYPNGFQVCEDRLFFIADDNDQNGILFVSDGTREGTHVVRDIKSKFGSEFAPEYFTTFGSVLLFSADDTLHGPELWRSDGTVQGTWMVRDVNPTDAIGITWSPFAFRDFVLFRAVPDGQTGELWRSDGTLEGTSRIEVSSLMIEPFLTSMASLDDCVVFGGRSPDTGLELWRTDGTAEGTYLLRDIFPGPTDSQPLQLKRLGEVVLFQARDPVYGLELWKTDGTTEGTVLLRDLTVGKADGDPSTFHVAVNKAFFVATTPETGHELWITDGTSGGTHLVIDMIRGPESSAPYAMRAIDTRLVFSAKNRDWGEEMWVTDGTAAGTMLVRDINPGPASSEPYNTRFLDGIAYFQANDGVHGMELWRSDLTEAGTRMVTDLALPPTTQPSSEPVMLTQAGHEVCFIARGEDGLCRPWRSDGTDAGTRPFAEGPSGASADQFLTMCHHLGNIFVAFRATGGDTALWALGMSDGTASVVADLGVVASDARVSVAVLGDALYFSGCTGAYDAELMRVTGTLPAPEVVRNVFPGPAATSPRCLTVHRGRLFFAARDAEHGEELWVLDGHGMRLVADVRPGEFGSGIESIVGVEGDVYFTADDGVHGPELWTSDGTTGTTHLVADINPVQQAGALRPGWLTAFGSMLAFTASDGVSGIELWITSGDAASTVQVDDTLPGPASSNPESLVVSNGRMYFRAEGQDRGIELFVSDGTHEGTYLLHDIMTGPGSSHPDGIMAFGPYVVFAANSASSPDSDAGNELYWTDGVRFETMNICASEQCNSDPREFVSVDDWIYLTAFHALFGRELWRLHLDAPHMKADAEMVKDILSIQRTVVPLASN